MSNYKATPIKYVLRNRNESVVYVPIATAKTYGLVKADKGLTIHNGVLSVKNDITRSFVFDTLEQFKNWLSGTYENESYDLSEIMVGDIVRIKEEDVTDYWCAKKSNPVVLEDFIPCESVKNYVRFDVEQGLNDDEKRQARLNIGVSSTEDVDDIRRDVSSLKANKLNNTNNNSAIGWNNGALEVSVNGVIFDVNGSGVKHNGDRLATEKIVDNKISQIKKNIAYVFNDLETFKSWLDGDYSRPDGVVPSDLELGDNILLKEDDVPDYWLSNKTSNITFDDFTPWESYVNLADYLNKNNTKEYTPTHDYNPSTKKYVDDAIKNIKVDVTVDDALDLLSKNPVENGVITQNIVVRKSGLELSEMVGQTSNIYADMYTPCICSESYGDFIEGHIYLVYYQAYGTDAVRYRVAVKDISSSDILVDVSETAVESRGFTGVTKLSDEQYEKLYADGTLDVGGVTLTYQRGMIYVTPENKLETLSLTQANSMLISDKRFNQHVQILLEFETGGMHYGADFILHPYDTSICLVSYNFVGHTGTAYLDEYGRVNISIPDGLSLTNVKAHYVGLGE